MLRSDRPAPKRLAAWLLAAALALSPALSPEAKATSLSFNGTSDFANVATGIVTAPPFSICMWAQTTAVGTVQFLGGAFASGSASTNFFSVIIAGTGAVRITTTDGTAGNADSSATVSANTWFHACGIWTATNSRRSYLNGGNTASDSSTHTPTGIDRFSLGVRNSGTQASFCSCLIANVVVYNVALSAADVLALSLGASPLKIKPDAIVFFAPYMGVGSTVADWKGNSLTITGAVTNAGTPAGITHP